jgi:hypothetical protein
VIAFSSVASRQIVRYSVASRWRSLGRTLGAFGLVRVKPQGTGVSRMAG